MLITQIIKLKLQENLSRGNLGDEISHSLSFLDLLSWLSIKENFELETKQIFQNWKNLYKIYFEESLFETIKQISGNQVCSLEELSNIIKKESIQMETFNKKFKEIYNSDFNVQTSKIFFIKIKNKYSQSLHIYLNKEIIPEIVEAPKRIRGDIAYIED
ncbi:MAG: hypothetical protein ABH804_00045 [archaeon]